jgi:Spy/CpxP family protein refolding chaperone
MQNTWLKISFIFSLAVNCAVLGALGYPLARQYWGRGMQQAQLPEMPDEKFSPQVLQARADFRDRLWKQRMDIQKQREELTLLLMEQPPDKKKIEEKVRAISALQGTIQAETVEQILKETAAMTPEQRKEYLGTIRGLMCPQGMRGGCGKGPGFRGRMGRGGPGRGPGNW